MLIKLTGKTRHGKNKIREHGEIWQVQQVENSVQCLNNKPGMLLNSPDGDMRWIETSNDRNFDWSELQRDA